MILILLVILTIPVYSITIGEIRETESRDTIITRHIFGNGYIADLNNDKISYIHQDRVQSTRLITSTYIRSRISMKWAKLNYHANRHLDKKFKSLPFGQELINEGIKYTFATGKELDSSGLYYFGARYYDPQISRFISVDPFRENHAYSYVKNNPLNLIDPTGADDRDVWMNSAATYAVSEQFRDSRDIELEYFKYQLSKTRFFNSGEINKFGINMQSFVDIWETSGRPTIAFGMHEAHEGRRAHYIIPGYGYNALTNEKGTIHELHLNSGIGEVVAELAHAFQYMHSEIQGLGEGSTMQIRMENLNPDDIDLFAKLPAYNRQYKDSLAAVMDLNYNVEGTDTENFERYRIPGQGEHQAHSVIETAMWSYILPKPGQETGEFKIFATKPAPEKYWIHSSAHGAYPNYLLTFPFRNSLR